MKRLIGIFLSLLSCVAAEKLEVVADHFMADNQKGISVVEGNVDVKKGQDHLRAQKVTIYTTKDNKLKEVFAQGDVDFFITTPDGRKIRGRANSLRYNAQSQEYHLIGNAKAREEGKESSIAGDEIKINNQSGSMNVVGSKNKPAKLVFDLDELQKNKQDSGKKP